MEEQILSNAVSYDESWLSMPFCDKWKETYNFAKKHITENFNKKLASHFVDDIKAVFNAFMWRPACNGTNVGIFCKMVQAFSIAVPPWPQREIFGFQNH